MGGESEKKNIVLGILAHVDAGKTTLSEAMLYLSGRIKTLGRVDHRDSYLDTHGLERERGITIFSKQAIFELPETRLFLLDTPGHVDFAAETERTLRALDYVPVTGPVPDMGGDLLHRGSRREDDGLVRVLLLLEKGEECGGMGLGRVLVEGGDGVLHRTGPGGNGKKNPEKECGQQFFHCGMVFSTQRYEKLFVPL